KSRSDPTVPRLELRPEHLRRWVREPPWPMNSYAIVGPNSAQRTSAADADRSSDVGEVLFLIVDARHLANDRTSLRCFFLSPRREPGHLLAGRARRSSPCGRGGLQGPRRSGISVSGVSVAWRAFSATRKATP